MHFDGFFRGTEFAGNLLVEHPSYKPPHYFAFARGERFILPAQIRQPCPSKAGSAVRIHGSMDCIQEFLFPERLSQKFSRAGLRHRMLTRPNLEQK